MEATIAVKEALNPLCGGRVYSDHIPILNKNDNKSMWPAIRFFQIGGSVEGTNCDYGFNTRIQIDIYALDATERLDVIAQVEDAMDDITEFDVMPNSAPIHAYDMERNKYQATLDYTLS